MKRLHSQLLEPAGTSFSSRSRPRARRSAVLASALIVCSRRLYLLYPLNYWSLIGFCCHLAIFTLSPLLIIKSDTSSKLNPSPARGQGVLPQGTLSLTA